jgi:Protein of unknown function (DUF2934)
MPTQRVTFRKVDGGDTSHAQQRPPRAPAPDSGSEEAAEQLLQDSAQEREPRAVTAAGLSGSRPEISDVARRDMIARAAYFLAEQRGFVPGEEVADWLAAERDVEFFLAGGVPPKGLEVS